MWLPEMNARHTLDKIFPVVESLSTQEKAELVQHLLCNQSSLKIVIRNDPLQFVINQLELMTSKELGEILRAISLRIATEDKSLKTRVTPQLVSK